MNHFASTKFWQAYHGLPQALQLIADRSFDILKNNPQHPSLHFKKVGAYRSVRIGINYRALGVEVPDGVLWIWIGSHAEYDRIVR